MGLTQRSNFLWWTGQFGYRPFVVAKSFAEVAYVVVALA